MLEQQIREGFPHLDDAQVRFYLERDFPAWMKDRVRLSKSYISV